MSKLRSEEIHRMKLEQEDMWRDLVLRFSPGGISMMDYKEKPRGYSLSIQIVKRKNGWKEWAQGQQGDGTVFIEEASRFHQRKFTELAERIRQNAELIHAMMDTPGNLPNLISLLRGQPLPEPENVPALKKAG